MSPSQNAFEVPAWVAAIPCRNTVFWSGAGISSEPPTSAPRGSELTRRALEYGFLPEAAPLLRFYYRALELPHAGARPRLETVLDVLVRVHGTKALFDVLSDVKEARPNSLHKFLAAAAAHGARQITTNFDSCLEQAGIREALHIHGSFAEDPSGAALGATLAKIENGLSSTTRARLDGLLSSSGESLFVFIGYSGSDFFDIDPYLRSMAEGQLREKAVLWVSHTEDDPKLASNVEGDAPRQLAWLERAGAEVSHVRGRTREVLACLARQWQLGEPEPPNGVGVSWTPKAKPTEAMRERATLELYALMGLHREIDRLFAARDPKDPGEWNALANTRWSQGRKGEALDAWENALDGLALEERRAAIDWVRGRYWRAERRGREALKAADTLRTGPEPTLTERLVLAETYARIWEHMRRYPDSRLFATERMRRFALTHLPDPAELARAGTPIGTHLISRVRGARAALGASSEGSWEPIESFGEYEALSASLNYEHGRLRADAERGPVNPERYRRLHRQRHVIGDTSAAARIVFLPGAETVFGWREVFRASMQLDISWWHRGRLLLVEVWRRRVRAASPAPSEASDG